MTGPPADAGPPPGNANMPLAGDTPPSAMLAARLRRAAGDRDRYPGCDDAAVMIAAGRWDAVESHAAARKLAALRELIRRMPLGGGAGAGDGELPERWAADLADQAAMELSMAQGTAKALIQLAWDLEARLPLTGAALASGTLTLSKARMVANETAVLSADLARQAEAQVAPHWAGQTWTTIQRMIALAVVKVDPDGAADRRKQAETESGRYRFWRDSQTGTAGLGGFDLPADEALAANQKIQARARAYKRDGVDMPMELLRVQAFLDVLNGTDYRLTHPKPATPDTGTPGTNTDNPAPDFDDPGPDDDLGPDDPENGGDGLGSGGQGSDGQGGGLAANLDLTIPASTLLGLREHPGLADELGAVDPALARNLATAAARNLRTDIQVIVTDDHGRAIAFGHATRTRIRAGPAPPGQESPPGITEPAQKGENGHSRVASMTPAGTGPPGGYGKWTLDIAGNQFTVTLVPIYPGVPCDHRYESAGYTPSDTLRRLVNIRDGTCVFPTCGWRAKNTDWDHVVPWPQGRTCNCNGESRCRHDHILKQNPAWAVKYHLDGRHEWVTPLGLSYTKKPHRYPT